MKTKNLLPLLFFALAIFANTQTTQAQTKEETIAWLEGKLYDWSNYQNKKESDIQISPCTIDIYYIHKGEKFHYSFPTKFQNIDDNGDLQLNMKNIILRFSERENEVKKSWFFLSQNTPLDIRKRIEKAIHHLNTFCEKKKLSKIEELSRTNK